MGSGVSVIPPGVDDDIRELIEIIERQKSRIRLADATLLESEAGKMFKNHNKIIEDFTSRSKAQLRALFTELPNSLAQIELIASAGNQYASFLSKLHKSKFQIELQSLLETDYDEELVIGILCTSTCEEIKHIDQAFAAAKNFSLRDLLETKIKTGTSFMKFVDRIFQFRRNETKTIDQELAGKQADMIHQASSAKLVGVEEETIFNILSTASRAQCSAINQIYQERYKMKLDRALNMKFKGLQAKLMTLWAMPMPMAIACWCDHLLHKMIVDREKLSSFIARFDKDTLILANNACKELHSGKGLVDNLRGGGISGTLFQALRGWIDNPSPDKGFERILELFVQGKLQKHECREASAPISPSQRGKQASSPAKASPDKRPHTEHVGLDAVSIEELVRLMRDDAELNGSEGSEFGQEMRLKIKFLLEKQTHALKLYMIDHQLTQSEEASSSPSNAQQHNSSFSSKMGFSWRSARVGGTNSSSSSVSGSPVDSGSPTSPTQAAATSTSKRFSFSETSLSPKEDSSDNKSQHSPKHSGATPMPVQDTSPALSKRRRHSQSLPSYDETQEEQSNLRRNHDDDTDDTDHVSRHTNTADDTEETLHSDSKQMPVPAIGGLIRENSLFAQLKHVQDREHMDAHKDVDLVYDYLLPRFEAKDFDGEGVLLAEDFWQVVSRLPLPAFGLNAKAVDKIRVAQQSWVTQDETPGLSQEGGEPRHIVYYYEALLELAETLVGAILSRVDKGEKQVTKVIAALTAERKETTKTSDKEATADEQEGTKKSDKEEETKSPTKNRLTQLRAASFRRTGSSVHASPAVDAILKRQPSDIIKVAPQPLQRLTSSVKGAIREEESKKQQEERSEDTKQPTDDTDDTDDTLLLFEDFVPPYFLQYVLDTIMAFDLDMNNTLSVNELEMLVAAMQIPTLTVDTFFAPATPAAAGATPAAGAAAVKVFTPREVLRVIVRKIGRWFTPEVRHTGEDHYLCLVDIQSGAYFWFNARDESSVWAEVAETAAESNQNETPVADGKTSSDTSEKKPESKQTETVADKDETPDDSDHKKQTAENVRDTGDTDKDTDKDTDTDTGVQRRVKSSPRLLSLDGDNNDLVNTLETKEIEHSSARKSSKLSMTKSTSALSEGKEDK